LPNITQHQSAQTTKLLLIGDSGSGKTGALMSLAEAGYKLRIIDVDNGLDIVRNFATSPDSPYVKRNSKVAENISFATITDPMKNLNGIITPVKANVWPKVTSLLMHWKIEDEDLGKVVDWGPGEVLVIDSLTMLSQAALNWHLMINGALGTKRTGNEGRRDVGEAQRLLRSLFEMLYDSSIKCNVIVTSHVTLVSESGLSPQSEDAKGEMVTGYPSAIGRALSPFIPRYFNTVLYCKPVGRQHKIFTRTQGVVNVKSSAPLKVAPDYPLETGLADYFKAVRS